MNNSLALWATVVAFGVYRGLDPAMGWPLAVANGVAKGRASGVLRAMLPLAVGHLTALALGLLPIELIGGLLSNRNAVRWSAGVLALAFGLHCLARGRPFPLAKGPFAKLAAWSFALATARGAGLMLAPVTLGLCSSPRDADGGQLAREALMHSDIVAAMQVSVVCTATTLASAIAFAWVVYRFMGQRSLDRSRFGIDGSWGAALALCGAVTCALASGAMRL